VKLVDKIDKERYAILLPYALGLENPLANADNLERARPLLDNITPLETFVLVDVVVKRVGDIDRAKLIITRLLNSFANGLTREERPFKRSIPFFEELIEINTEFNAILDSFKPIITKINGVGQITAEHRHKLELGLKRLFELSTYYQLKENILFPVIEKHIEDSRCLLVLWAIHDDVRKTLHLLEGALKEDDYPLESFNRLIGKLFFDIKTVIFREEQILLPSIVENIPLGELKAMSEGQLMEGQVQTSHLRAKEQKIDLLTGEPTVVQLLEIFNNLPVDITLVDSEDRVVYFNTPEKRIFPRTKAVIGRTVQNCHPPTSLHLVEQILKAFKERRKERAEFRIKLKGRFILITYTAIYAQDGTYRGTMEVSQDISDLKAMEDEIRLLDWRD